MLVFKQHIIEYGIIQDLKIYSTSPDPKPKSARDGIFRAKPAGDNARAGTFIIHDGLDWPRDPFTCRAAAAQWRTNLVGGRVPHDQFPFVICRCRFPCEGQYRNRRNSFDPSQE